MYIQTQSSSGIEDNTCSSHPRNNYCTMGSKQENRDFFEDTKDGSGTGKTPGDLIDIETNDRENNPPGVLLEVQNDDAAAGYPRDSLEKGLGDGYSNGELFEVQKMASDRDDETRDLSENSPAGQARKLDNLKAWTKKEVWSGFGQECKETLHLASGLVSRIL